MREWGRRPWRAELERSAVTRVGLWSQDEYSGRLSSRSGRKSWKSFM
jgi:hypothetical protein